MHGPTKPTARAKWASRKGVAVVPTKRSLRHLARHKMVAGALLVTLIAVSFRQILFVIAEIRGVEISMRTLSIVEHATKVETYEVATQPGDVDWYYRTVKEKQPKPQGTIDGWYIVLKGPVENAAFANKMAILLSEPKTYGRDVIPGETNFATLFRVMSPQGRVDVALDFNEYYIHVERFDVDGTVSRESHTAVFWRNAASFFDLCQQALPKQFPNGNRRR
jgi:hypothetical protein